jgi:hypothetical protein
VQLHTESRLRDKLFEILACAPMRLEALRAVRSLGLNDCAIGAGFIRAAVWDYLSHLGEWTAVEDVDVIYFDPKSADPRCELAIERSLAEMMPGLPWSVRNQARMHLRNGDRPYVSTLDALHFWLETPTCIAVCLSPHDHLELLAPFGLADLFAMTIRPTPRGRERISAYRQRLQSKRWHERWPGVRVDN